MHKLNIASTFFDDVTGSVTQPCSAISATCTSRASHQDACKLPLTIANCQIKHEQFHAGDKPELLYPEAAAELASMGYSSTIDYVYATAKEVYMLTGLLPHINAGVMDKADLLRWGAAPLYDVGIVCETCQAAAILLCNLQVMGVACF